MTISVNLDHRVTAADGVGLAATLFPPSDAVRGSLLISGATGVPRGYYKSFARFAASRGFLVASYDYRGIAGSAQGPSRLDPSRMSEWGTLDLTAMIAWLKAREPSLPLFHIGHSVGGQLLGLAANHSEVKAAVGISAQSGDWRLWPAGQRLRRLLDFYILLPGMVRLFGHLPKQIFGTPLPPGVALEWASWCRTKGYLTGVVPGAIQRFAAFAAPYLFVDIADDDYAPADAVDGLASYFSNARKSRRTIHPREYGLRRIGHFGYFRSSMSEQAWSEPLDWLLGASV